MIKSRPGLGWDVQAPCIFWRPAPGRFDFAGQCALAGWGSRCSPSRHSFFEKLQQDGVTRLCLFPFPFRTGGRCPRRPFCDCRASPRPSLRILSRRRLADLTVPKQPSGNLFFSAKHLCVLIHLHRTPPVSAWTGIALLTSTLFPFSDMGLPSDGILWATLARGQSLLWLPFAFYWHVTHHIL